MVGVLRLFFQLWVVTGLLLVSVPAVAQDVDELARREYELGFKDLQNQRYRPALQHYERSYQYLPRPRTAYNIALCHEALGNTEEAIALFQKFLLEAEERDAEFLTSAREKIDALHSKIGGTIRVHSDPSGAGVTVNGELRGHTPLRLDLLAGEHLIAVQRKGTRSSERSIDVRAGDNRVEEFPLDRVGRVKLSVRPGDALIRRKDVDDVSTGFYEADLSPGKYDFELSLLGYETRLIKINVKASDTINRTIRLRGQSSTGALRLRSDESGAMVSVDGLAIGSTRTRDGRAQIERRLTAGNHVIIVESRSGASWSKRFHVSPGETLQVDLRFQSGTTKRKYARWGLTTIGVGAVASGLAVGVLALTDVRAESLNSHDRGFARATTADVLLGIGALSLGGAYLLRGDAAQATLERTHEEGEEAKADEP